MKKTDWDSYYDKPYKTASVTRKITGNKIVALMKSAAPADTGQLRIVELGGANSCFYELIQEKIRPLHYKIVDNNNVGLQKFIERIGLDSSTSLECVDILATRNESTAEKPFQIAFSVGLIEHFSVAETAKAIRAHFRFLERGGICLITFPTPTWLYKISRRVSEMLGMWIFWDERPLGFAEVEQEVVKYGAILHKSITWSIFFTQGVIVAKKK